MFSGGIFHSDDMQNIQNTLIYSKNYLRIQPFGNKCGRKSENSHES